MFENLHSGMWTPGTMQLEGLWAWTFQVLSSAVERCNLLRHMDVYIGIVTLLHKR
jgi:hypothetical protein